jgi:aspartyl-tRNA(Asn)/glutamyl-tRNA(Gln) amidotransferase subunit C
MSLNSKQVGDVAHLARLSLTDEQAARYARELSAILELVDELARVDTSHVEPLAHPLGMTQRLRPDVVSEPDQREAFLAIAPAVVDGLFLVPRVIE